MHLLAQRQYGKVPPKGTRDLEDPRKLGGWGEDDRG